MSPICTYGTTDTADADVAAPYEMADATGCFTGMDELRFFTFHKVKYIWRDERDCFVATQTLDLSSIPLDTYHSSTPLNAAHVLARQRVYGHNLIEVATSIFQ
jgi:hypothetical protein